LSLAVTEAASMGTFDALGSRRPSSHANLSLAVTASALMSTIVGLREPGDVGKILRPAVHTRGF
jgi:hypothetical protein